MRTALRTGSVLAIVTGSLHLLAQLQAPDPPTDAHRTMLELMTRLRFDAGGVQRSMMDVVTGLSLSFSVLFFLMGVHGLRLARLEDRGARRDAAFAYATAAAVLTGLGLLYFPTPPIVLTAGMLVAYVVAAVRA